MKKISQNTKWIRKEKVLNIYRKIPAFLGNENKKFQISKVEPGARKREYAGTIEWLDNAGFKYFILYGEARASIRR